MKDKTVLLKFNGISDEFLINKLDLQSNKNEYIKSLIWKDILENGSYTIKQVPDRVNPYVKKEQMKEELENSRSLYRFSIPRYHLNEELSSFFSLMSEERIYSQQHEDVLSLVKFFRENNLTSKPVKEFGEWHYIKDKIDSMTDIVKTNNPELVSVFEGLKANEDSFTLGDVLDTMIFSWNYIRDCEIVTFRCLKVMADIALFPETEQIYHEFWNIVEELCSSWKTLDQQEEERKKELLSRVEDTIKEDGFIFICKFKDAEWGDMHCCIRKFIDPVEAFEWFCDANDEFPNSFVISKEKAVKAGYKDGMAEFVCDIGIGTFL